MIREIMTETPEMQPINHLEQRINKITEITGIEMLDIVKTCEVAHHTASHYQLPLEDALIMELAVLRQKTALIHEATGHLEDYVRVVSKAACLGE